MARQIEVAIVTITDGEGWEAEAIEQIMGQTYYHKRKGKKIRWVVVTPDGNEKIESFIKLTGSKNAIRLLKLGEDYNFDNGLEAAIDTLPVQCYTVVVHDFTQPLDEKTLMCLWVQKKRGGVYYLNKFDRHNTFVVSQVHAQQILAGCRYGDEFFEVAKRLGRVDGAEASL